MDQKEISAKILSGPEPNIPKLQGLGSTLFYKMLEHKDEISVTCGVTAHNETYEQLINDSILAATAMRRKGIKPYDVITICSDNYPDCLSVYCASLFLGAISANIDPDLSIPEIAKMVKQIRPKLIFVDPPYVKLMKLSLRETKIETPLIVFGDPEMNIGFSQFLLVKPEKNFVPFEIDNLKTTACVVFTSGLTKAVSLTHYGLLGHIYNAILPENPPGCVVLTFSNLSWMSSITLTIFSIINGYNQVLYPKFDPDSVWNLITEHKPNIIFLTPYQILEVCKNGRPENTDTSSLQFVLLTGDPIHKQQMLHIRKCLPGTLIINSYSQTEQNGSVIAFRPLTVPNDKKLMEEKPEYVGKPMPGYIYKIVNPETEEILGPFQEGELHIKSDFTTNGYYNMESMEIWDSDGFIKTGDIAYYDSEQCFFIRDRIKDLIPAQASYISPFKIEAIFYTNSAVHLCVVIGIENQVMGVVVLTEEAVGNVQAKDLEKYINERVEEHKVRVKIVEKIPLTFTDKIDRGKVKQFLLEKTDLG